MRREPNRRAAAVLMLALLTAATGCSGAPRPSGPTPPPPPQSLQADSVASEEFGLLAGGGWAQAWTLWTDQAQQAIAQADFVRLNTECRPLIGVPYVIDRTTGLDPSTVRIDWHHGATTGSNTLVHQGGRWRFTPDPGALADYRLGVEPLVQKRRAAGACH
ncbi:hypothetical protein P3T37_001592 [Kitasatospora sp. MAA4]|uniref:hypothetical protein n=1 Tax=Kitasatospora sp. MAA4 TaxID=3035093 RepID=UPI0024751CB7|nr:hypothetical protein [Kitasatospora sp. MAA4]MDH6132207.1 hypothetical protein [Kitasatospora sp. MAA4]